MRDTEHRTQDTGYGIQDTGYGTHDGFGVNAQRAGILVCCVGRSFPPLSKKLLLSDLSHGEGRPVRVMSLVPFQSFSFSPPRCPRLPSSALVNNDDDDDFVSDPFALGIDLTRPGGVDRSCTHFFG